MANRFALNVLFSGHDGVSSVADRVTTKIKAMTKDTNALVNSSVGPFLKLGAAAGKFADALGVSTISKAVGNVGTKLSGVADAAETSFRRVIGVTAVATGAAYLFKSQFIDTASTFENLKIQLEGIEGSADAAKTAMSFIQKVTIDTPFEMEDIGATFRTLRGFGMDAFKNMQPIVDSVAKIGGGGEKLQHIALQLGQAWSKGRLLAQDSNILVENGIPVWGLLERAVARVNGGHMVGVKLLRQMSENGQLGQKAIGLLIEQMGIESAGASERMMHTWSGMISNLSDYWTLFKLRVMDSGPFDLIKSKLAGILATIQEWAADGTLQRWADRFSSKLLLAFNWLEANGPTILKQITDAVSWLADKAGWVADKMGGWGNLVSFGLAVYIGGPLVVSVFSLVGAMIALGIAIQATPIGWAFDILLGVTALGGGLLALTTTWQGFKDFWSDLWTGARLVLDGFLSFLHGNVIEGLTRVAVGIEKIFGAATRPIVGLFKLGKGAYDGLYNFGDQKIGRPDVDGAGLGMPSTPNLGWKSGVQFSAGPGRPILDSATGTYQPVTLGASTANRPGSAWQQQVSKFILEIGNAPAGSKLKASPGNSAPADVSLGYSMQESY